MAILPDDIRDISSMQLPQQIDTILKYIKYMKEQIEFWGGNREKSFKSIEDIVAELTYGLNTLAGAVDTILNTTIPAMQDDISALDAAVKTLSIYNTDGTKIWPPS